MSCWPDEPDQAVARSQRASPWPVQAEGCQAALGEDHGLDSLHQELALQSPELRAQTRDRLSSSPAGEPHAAIRPAPPTCRQSPSLSSSQDAVQLESRALDPNDLQDKERRLPPGVLSPFLSNQTNFSGPTETAIYSKQQPELDNPAELGDEDDTVLPEESCGAGLLGSSLISRQESPATVEELRVKNRTAQKRYRERQKVSNRCYISGSADQHTTNAP